MTDLHLPTRRHHQKSRSGCMTCKQKKIKCDEGKPSCNFCARRSLDCTYPTSKSSLLPTLNSQGTRTPSHGPRNTTPVSSTPSSTSSPFISTPSTSSTFLPPVLSSNYSLPDAQWTIIDFELMHFYTVSTSQTFSNVPARRHVWQFVIPQIAFSHDFLLHGLLALAAIHLSRESLDRKETLLAIASSHYATALPIFRSTLQNINSANHTACAAFGTILTVYEWATTKHSSNLFFAPSQYIGANTCTIEWVQLLRGSGQVIRYNYEELSQGPIGPIMTWDNEVEHHALANPTEAVRFASLEQLWNSEKLSLNLTEAEALQDSLQWLKIIYTMMKTPHADNDPASAALSWPTRVSEVYLQMASQRHPAALVVLAHFCLLLNKIDDFWWIRGMSRRLLQEIHQILGAEWEQWISWPLQDLVLCEFQKESGLPYS